MDKKKKPVKTTEEIEEISIEKDDLKEAPTFVTEIVEEIQDDEENVEKYSKEDETETEKKEDVVEEIEEEKEEFENEVFDQRMEKKEPEFESRRPEVTKRQMVEDIYSSKQEANVVDIALNKKKKTQPTIVWAIIIIAVALLTGGGMILLTKSMGSSKKSSVEPTPTITQVVSPTPVPAEIKREDLDVQVLNGGGVAGAGSKMKTFLTDLGYTVSDVGNTDEYTFEKTEIEVKPGKDGALELLRNDLAKDYSLGTMAATLASDSAYDVRVTVGK